MGKKKEKQIKFYNTIELAIQNCEFDDNTRIYELTIPRRYITEGETNTKTVYAAGAAVNEIMAAYLQQEYKVECKSIPQSKIIAALSSQRKPVTNEETEKLAN